MRGGKGGREGVEKEEGPKVRGALDCARAGCKLDKQSGCDSNMHVVLMASHWLMMSVQC